MQVNQAANDLGQPLVGIMPAKVTVAGVEVDADGGAPYEIGRFNLNIHRLDSARRQTQSTVPA